MGAASLGPTLPPSTASTTAHPYSVPFVSSVVSSLFDHPGGTTCSGCKVTEMAETGSPTGRCPRRVRDFDLGFRWAVRHLIVLRSRDEARKRLPAIQDRTAFFSSPQTPAVARRATMNLHQEMTELQEAAHRFPEGSIPVPRSVIRVLLEDLPSDSLVREVQTHQNHASGIFAFLPSDLIDRLCDAWRARTSTQGGHGG